MAYGLSKLTRITRSRDRAFAVSLVAALLLAAVLIQHFRAAPQELRVGYNGYHPFVMSDSHGRPTGLAVEIITEAARRANIKLQWIAGESLDDALRNGTVDLFPMLTLTPARVAEFHVSQPWWENETGLISLESAPIPNSLATSGKRIAIRGLPLLKALAQTLFPQSTLVTIPDVGAMVNELCLQHVDAAFIDVRILQAQLLKGSAACVNHPLHVISVPGGSLSQGTIASKQVADIADRLYEQIALIALDGTLSEIASRWSMVSTFQNRHMKDTLDDQQRARTMRYGLLFLTVALVVTWIQSQRLRRVRRVADESQQRFDAFMKHTPALTFIMDERGHLVYMNEALSHPFQLSLASVAKQFRFDSPSVMAENSPIESTETIALPSGEVRHFLCLRFPFFNSDGKRFVGFVALDITERKKAEEALRLSQFSIEHSPDSILWIDSNQRISYANGAACKALGYSSGELIGLPASAVDAEYLNNSIAQHDQLNTLGFLSAESSHGGRNGPVVPVDVALYRLQFDGSEFTCCISRDITERKQAERELSHQAQHDLLTGLPNRRYFESRLEQSLRAASAAGAGLGIFYFDLDGFKLINDTLGHAVGDAVLQQLVRRVSSYIRDTDTLARMGGDEFTIICPGVSDQDGARRVGEKLLSGLRESFVVNGHELLVSASIGIALYPADGLESATLLQHADAAMYDAKRHGKNRLQFFNAAMNRIALQRLTIENHLRRAMERNEFSLHYQPQIRLHTNEIVRYEALLRWNSPSVGNLPPDQFIPLAEETGLIVPIGTWVLEQACQHARQLYDAGEIAGVSVNISSTQFCRPDFADIVIAALHHSGLPPFRLELELTETVVTRGMKDVIQKIERLRDLGVTISIDDFGTGYSSLSYLQSLRIDCLKIDRSFITDITFDSKALSVTRALITLAHGLGMQVVIEGVETQQQLEAVRSLGGDMAQGYYFGTPRPAAEAAECQLAETR